jgi:hypothetical protein
MRCTVGIRSLNHCVTRRYNVSSYLKSALKWLFLQGEDGWGKKGCHKGVTQKGQRSVLQCKVSHNVPGQRRVA